MQRQKWKVRNISYVEKLLNITEKYKIFWRLKELVKDNKKNNKNEGKNIEGKKGEWLWLKVNRKMLLNIEEGEIDWEKTFEYIINKEEGGSRNYKHIMNWKKGMMKCLNKDVKDVDKKKKDWIHIWSCGKNDPKIYDLIEEVIDIQIKEMEADNQKEMER
ncbi:hypothetical protein C1645_838592 [Glomus cerebriforme]|uniref:Uncharacterized protein n=1 Tax=Glomus cerebriforme TaxID=658196 RepID=A0A397S3E8_9GLOM|nr:hypothetical protein C1645_838592 [Glomus cerebriforme]